MISVSGEQARRFVFARDWQRGREMSLTRWLEAFANGRMNRGARQGSLFRA